MHSAQEPAPPTRRRFSLNLGDHLKSRHASILDQGFQGIANLGVNALLARSLIKADFASVGLMLGVYFFVLGFHRSNVVVPFILDTSRSGEDAHKDADRWWWFNLGFVALVAAVLFAVSAVAHLIVPPSSAWVTRALDYAPVVAPCLCMTEFGRRWLYYAGKPVAAATAAFVYFVINVLIATIVLITGAGLGLGVSAWVMAAAGYMTVVIWAAPPLLVRPGQALSVWQPHAQFSGWQMLNHLPYAIYNNSVVLLIGFFGGAMSAAVFSAARTLSSPILSFAAAVDLLDKPRAARALATNGVAGLKASISRTRRLLMLSNGAYTLLVLLATHQLLQLAFGDRYLGHELEVQIVAVGFFLFGLNQPSETMLIVLRASKVMLLTRCIAATSAVAALALLAKPFGTGGCAAAIVLVQLINIIGLRLAERHATRYAARVGLAVAS